MVVPDVVPPPFLFSLFTFPGVALVHDISQRLFPHADEDELIYAMTSVLRVPLLDLTPDISAAFASRNPQFLPPKAKTHKLIRFVCLTLSLGLSGLTLIMSC